LPPHRTGIRVIDAGRGDTEKGKKAGEAVGADAKKTGEAVSKEAKKVEGSKKPSEPKPTPKP
jgi:hypothetical protein